MKALGCLLLVAVVSVGFTQNPKPKLFVVDVTGESGSATSYGSTVNAHSQIEHYCPVIMAEFVKKCQAVAITTDRSKADFVIQGQPKSSILSDSSGAVVYVSKAMLLHNMAKDVCTFIAQEKH
jgi:hypothetical protein